MRIGVSLPEKLLSRFDEIILKRGYSSRSEGIRDAIRNYIVHYEWMSDVQGSELGSSPWSTPTPKGGWWRILQRFSMTQATSSSPPFMFI